MELLSARVRDFRCVDDSEEFKIADVTCLVGKNESGKTAILKALHKLKPDAESKESFVPERDYPKRKWRPDTPIPSNPPAIETTWKLDPKDIAVLDQTFGKGVIKSPEFSLSKGFDNVRRFGIEADEAVIVKKLVADANLSTDERNLVGKCNTVKELNSVLTELKDRSAAQEALLLIIKKTYPNGGEMAVINE